MADVDYPKWATFYEAILHMYAIHPGAKVCECACGTGSLTIALAEKGYALTGVDLSEEMLFEASKKARRAGVMIPFVKQDMRALRLHRQMDAVLATCDGLNYLAGDEDVSMFFASAFAALREGGVLAFDLSTPYKLEHVLGDNFIGDETADIAYLWKNVWHEKARMVEMELSIFVRQQEETYQRLSESQRQYAHDLPRLKALLEAAGFADIRVFGDVSFAPPKPDEPRWHLAARKPLQPQQEGAYE